MKEIVYTTPVTSRKDKNLPGILVISEDYDVHSVLDNTVDINSYQIIATQSQTDALSCFKSTTVTIVFLDIEKVTWESINLVNYIKRTSPDIEVVIITSIDKIRDANQCIRYGAALYLVKPLEIPDVRAVLKRVANLTNEHSESRGFEHKAIADLIGGCDSMNRLLKLAEKIAPTTSTVLISGETGTGKEMLARVIHRLSGRKDERFVAVNCGAIPETLFESELFGYKKGSFTGAYKDKIGLVEKADQGTLFLDEVGDLSLASQVKLLRFLQERIFRRVGDTADRKISVRIIAASNRNLRDMVDTKEFRLDLLYRLNVFNLHIPPLRERMQTLPNLVQFFAHRYNALYDKQVNRISADAERVLTSYSYPGNVRELENIIEHALVLSEGSEITSSHLPDFLHPEPLQISGPVENTANENGFQTLEEMEKQHIIKALKLTDNNYGKAAEKLGVCRATLWRKIKIYSIEKN